MISKLYAFIIVWFALCGSSFAKGPEQTGEPAIQNFGNSPLKTEAATFEESVKLAAQFCKANLPDLQNIAYQLEHAGYKIALSNNAEIPNFAQYFKRYTGDPGIALSQVDGYSLCIVYSNRKPIHILTIEHFLNKHLQTKISRVLINGGPTFAHQYEWVNNQDAQISYAVGNTVDFTIFTIGRPSGN